MFFGKYNRFCLVLLADGRELPTLPKVNDRLWVIPEAYLQDDSCFRAVVTTPYDQDYPYRASLWLNKGLVLKDHSFLPSPCRPMDLPPCIHTFWPWAVMGHRPLQRGSLTVAIQQGDKMIVRRNFVFVREAEIREAGWIDGELEIPNSELPLMKSLKSQRTGLN